MSVLSIIYWLWRLIVIGAIIHVVLEGRQPAKTMAWALVIYFLPLFGVIAYIFFGVNRRKERYVGRRSMDMLTKRSMLSFVEQHHLHIPAADKPLVDLFAGESLSLPFGQNSVKVMTSGYEFFPSLLHDIASARSHIHICIYIFEDDALGRLVSDALIAKARQGVEVRVVYDHVGCWSVSNRFFERLREGGVEVEAFMPVRFPRLTSKANYRNHRKIIVIDGRTGYIGGMNIALRYVKGTATQPWRDTMVRISGRGVYTLQRAFLIDWYFVDRTVLTDRKFYPTQQSEESEGHWAPFLQTVTSAPVETYPEIMQGYLRILHSARRYVYIESPYFMPTDSVFLAMKTAAAAGIDVRMLVPLRSDTRIAEWASRSYLREAVEAGIRVSLYQAGFLHSKLMVADDHIATCGSTNADFRSFENNFEANTFFYDDRLARQFKEIFLNDERQAVPMTALDERMHPSFPVRLGEAVVRLFSPLL